jgi:hypothetical protein
MFSSINNAFPSEDTLAMVVEPLKPRFMELLLVDGQKSLSNTFTNFSRTSYQMLKLRD